MTVNSIFSPSLLTRFTGSYLACETTILRSIVLAAAKVCWREALQYRSDFKLKVVVRCGRSISLVTI